MLLIKRDSFPVRLPSGMCFVRTNLLHLRMETTRPRTIRSRAERLWWTYIIAGSSKPEESLNAKTTRSYPTFLGSCHCRHYDDSVICKKLFVGFMQISFSTTFGCVAQTGSDFLSFGPATENAREPSKVLVQVTARVSVSENWVQWV